MKGGNLSPHHETHPRTRPFYDLCTKRGKERFNLSPLDRGLNRIRKNRSEGSLMGTFHPINGINL